MLPWILIIGGGVLAAMFLFGDDEEEEKEDDDRRVRSDGGEEYYDPSQEIGDEYDEPGEVGGPIVEYNPTEPAGEERVCTCDESGCFNCPPGEDGTENCFACSPDNDEPEVQ